MSDLHPRGNPWPMIDGMRRWWRDWRGARSGAAELECCGACEVERLARDLGMSAAELRKIAGRGPESGDLLLSRMAALDLDRNEIAATEPRVFQDLQRVCALCENHR